MKVSQQDWALTGHCQTCLVMQGERRQGNALNVEIGAPLNRCLQKPPVHWANPEKMSMRWLLSGGSPLVFDLCTPSACPSANNASCFAQKEEGSP